MKNLFAFFLVIAICVPARAQDEAMPPEPGYLMFNQNIVAMSNLQKTNDFAIKTFAPVLNALVDEGKIASWGILNHSWGDEWNWNWYIFAETRDSFYSAWSEALRRMNETSPGWGAQMMALIEEHKDGLYSVRNFRAGAFTDGQAPPRFLMLNQNIALPENVARLNEIMDTVTGPVLDELLAEGYIASWGDLGHSWGDEWNMNWWMGTRNQAAFLTAWAELVSRVQERAPGVISEASNLTKRHRDNFYYHRYMYPGDQ